jgi:glycerol kinase
MEIWQSQIQTARDVMAKANIDASNIAAIGITNQRETTIMWDKKTGQPVYNAIVWQDRRTAPILRRVLKRKKDLAKYIMDSTGLVIDAYFSATKIKWILDNVKGARKKAEDGELCFGTVDTWLTYMLTGGQLHITDYSNASRTMLFNIKTKKWDDKILTALKIPRIILPEVMDSSKFYGLTDRNVFDEKQIPIAGIAGIEQAALFGQACFHGGHGQKYLWYRLLYAHEYRGQNGQVQSRYAHHHSLGAKWQGGVRTRGQCIHSWCCAAMVAGWSRHHQ